MESHVQLGPEGKQQGNGELMITAFDYLFALHT